MTKLDDLIEKQKQLTEAVVAEAKAYYEAVGPVEVEAMFGETLAVFKVPFVHPNDFGAIAEKFFPRPGVAVDAPLWFNLDAVTRNYPGVTLEVDGEVDDLWRVRNHEAVYIFGELYDQMPPEHAQNFRMAVWALNVWEPQQRMEKKVAERKAADKEKEAENA